MHGMDPYERVLAEPGSIAARKALAAHWKAQGDPRAELLEKQVTLRDLLREGYRGGPRLEALSREIAILIRDHGKEWAGELAPFVGPYAYKRGLVAQVDVPGEKLPGLASRIFALAPIQHLRIVEPLGLIEAIFAVPELARLTSLGIERQRTFNDAAALVLARCKHLASLRWLSLYGDSVGRPGVEALAASPYLTRVEFLSLAKNPCDPTPYARETWEGSFEGGRPALAAELEAKFGHRPWLAVPSDPEHWPPGADELATTD